MFSYRIFTLTSDLSAHCPREDNVEYTRCLEEPEGNCRAQLSESPGEKCKSGCFCQRGYYRSVKNASICLNPSQCHKELASMGEKSPFDGEFVKGQCKGNEEYRNGPDDSCKDVIDKEQDDDPDGSDEYLCKCKKSYFRETNSPNARCVKLRDCPQGELIA